MQLVFILYFYYFSLIPYTSVHMEKYQLNQSIQLAIRSLNLASSSEQHYTLFYYILFIYLYFVCIFPTTGCFAVFSSTYIAQPLTCNWKMLGKISLSIQLPQHYLLGFTFNGFGKMKTKVNFNNKKLAREK